MTGLVFRKIRRAPSYARFKDLLTRSRCTRCGLSRGRTNIVVDRGNPRAKILVVGEAPGRHEDEQGKAFVGQAGKLFDKILGAAGLNSDRDLLITNIVKCR
ncbi:MAG TPA: uracil-DNA glycosylase, partial [Elusimicrobiota bacterium]|nr:uracil-DNA glycosylase [Elusimicrobiota bacterium]